MNAKEFAAMLNGREYTKEISKAESAQAKAAGLIVVFPAKLAVSGFPLQQLEQFFSIFFLIFWGSWPRLVVGPRDGGHRQGLGSHDLHLALADIAIGGVHLCPVGVKFGALPRKTLRHRKCLLFCRRKPDHLRGDSVFAVLDLDDADIVGHFPVSVFPGAPLPPLNIIYIHPIYNARGFGNFLSAWTSLF